MVHIPRLVHSGVALCEGLSPTSALSNDWEESTVQELVARVLTRTGHDFSNYKRSTILRRAERRMALHQISNDLAYLELLRQSPDEVQALFEDFLIGVTSFFRDPVAFEALRLKVLPDLLRSIPDGAPIRVWVPGCATGEESYSIAILLHEQLAALNSRVKPQIFATDIDVRALQIARTGVYPSKIADDISEERLKRFFTREGSGFRICSRLRSSLVFATHDLNRDSPFARLDLVSCRNLLIYLSPAQKDEVVPIFASALRPGGALMLGSCESIATHHDVFSPLDREARLYLRNVAPASARPIFNKANFARPRRGSAHSAADRTREPAMAADARMEQLVVGERGFAAPQLRTTAIEMQCANEKLILANEKLLSLNEELKTSKEELYAVNEEIFLLSRELGDKICDLKQRANDMLNLLAAMQIGTLYVDHNLQIQRFTSAVTDLICIIPGDIGRPLGDLRSKFQDYDSLEKDVRATLDTLVSRSLELRSTAGPSYLLKIQPYRTTENAIEGALLTFVDISELARVKPSPRQH